MSGSAATSFRHNVPTALADPLLQAALNRVPKEFIRRRAEVRQLA